MGAANNNQIKGSIVEGLLSATTDPERLRSKRATGIIEELRFHKAVVDAGLLTTSEVWIARITKKVIFNDDVRVISTAALAANATDFTSLFLEVDDGAGGANTMIASGSSTLVGTGSWVAGTAFPLTMNPTVSSRIVDGWTAPKFIIFRIAKGGAGIATPPLTIFASYEIVD